MVRKVKEALLACQAFLGLQDPKVLKETLDLRAIVDRTVLVWRDQLDHLEVKVHPDHQVLAFQEGLVNAVTQANKVYTFDGQWKRFIIQK